MSAPTDIVFHGVRGSAPASGAECAEFGGDTPAIEVIHDGSRLFIDAGSGLRNVRMTGSAPDEIDLVLSHYHYDHLIGLPFFEMAWRMKGRLRIFAPQFGADAPFDILSTFFSSPFCPVRLDDLSVRVDVIAYRPGDSWQSTGGATIATRSVNHPGGCAAIRVNSGAGDLVYATDVEISGDADARSLAEFSRGADLLIMDAMNDETNAETRRGWGHSTWRDAVTVGDAAGAGAIALFHHDPRRTDIELSAIDAMSRELYLGAFAACQGRAFRLRALAVDGEVGPWRCNRYDISSRSLKP